ncbi:MAG: Glu/Leu/Phe/Val dehydrogenase dimerization domain-containing protein [bacterium]|nr:Glu/Leu/Phe/Val dehydrogenase dimerization domain-containing protein [bacterium]MDZ4284500.1 Glu/Leu/Phe/Val dehydrogenase dimerization domain-containing protein [Patescibacteria group bacterium]
MAAQSILGTHEFSDERRGFHAFIAIDDLTLGPALGGIRMYPYRCLEEARTDCERLARAMTLKSALARVPLGGGKMVVVGNPLTDKKDALYRFVADCINPLGGTYIAACDVGWNPPDLLALGKLTPYAALPPRKGICDDDTAEMTATGVVFGIQAVIEHCCDTREIRDLWFALQGIGNVGRRTGIKLYRSGAGNIFICDDITEKVRLFKHVCPRENVEVSSTATIYDQPADIFVPCARGGVLTEETIERLAEAGFSAVAGSANNQLAEPEEHTAALLYEKDICYAPDFVINAGGVIDCAAKIAGKYSKESTKAKALEIGPRLLDIFKRAKAANCSPHTIALADAERILGEARTKKVTPQTPPVSPA